jgi:DNA-binding response OmpR family regulator
VRRTIISNVHIAVVDNERLTRDFVATVMMYSVNRDVLVFEDVDGLKGHLDSGKALHMVLSEIHLPGKSGFELLRLLKRSRPRTCFVAMSSNPADEIPATELGADAFLARPFALKDLFAIVQRFVVEGPDFQADATMA